MKCGYGTVSERGGPDGDRRPVLHLGAGGQHTGGAAADQLRRAKRLVNTFQNGLRGRQVRAAGEHDSDVGALAREAHGGCLRRLDGTDAGVVRAREADADANWHDPHDTDAVPEALIALFGPTGVGKTDVALALAGRLRERGKHPVAVSADALQVYAGLELLTGVATAAQQRVLEHRLVSFLPVDARFSVAEYAALAHAQIDELLADGATPIVIGGTGLYLRAALTELALRPPPPAARASAGTPSSNGAGPRRCTRCSSSAHRGPPPASTRPTVIASCARWSSRRSERSNRRRGTRSCGARRFAIRRGSSAWTMERGELYARVDRRVDATVGRFQA